MMNSERTAQTVSKLAQSAAQALLTAQARVTDQFAAGVMLSSGTMEALIEAQAAAHLTAKIQTRWNRAGMAAVEEWLEDAADQLMFNPAPGSTSQVQNEMERAERKAMQAAYRALNRCRA